MDAFKHGLLKGLDQQISDDYQATLQERRAQVETWKASDPKTRGARPTFHEIHEPKPLLLKLLAIATQRSFTLDEILQACLSRSVRPEVDAQAREIRDELSHEDLALVQSLTKQWPPPEPRPEIPDDGAKPPSPPRVDPNPPKKPKSDPGSETPAPEKSESSSEKETSSSFLKNETP